MNNDWHPNTRTLANHKQCLHRLFTSRHTPKRRTLLQSPFILLVVLMGVRRTGNHDRTSKDIHHVNISLNRISHWVTLLMVSNLSLLVALDVRKVVMLRTILSLQSMCWYCKKPRHTLSQCFTTRLLLYACFLPLATYFGLHSRFYTLLDPFPLFYR